MPKNTSVNVEFEEKMKRLTTESNQQFEQSKDIEQKIKENLANLNIGGKND